jgi:outer membrane protein OmpA-like peptidoglycan-associated protein
MQGFYGLCIRMMCGIVLLSGCRSSHTPSGSTANAIVNEAVNRQKQELEAVLPDDTIVELVSDGDALRVTFNSGVLFATNSNTINEAFRSALRQLTESLNNNPETEMRITGHTDNTGNIAYNQTLSERRARSVYDYLREQGVDAVRMAYSGKGIHEPVADNHTVEGRALNRRVEIMIEWRKTGELIENWVVF